ncbi:hypothetical protein I203_100224 [Kwoniella mangroviensis CBS 8507]|uniref:uncharacterized protein n=1 Tax=Kwoniella mangroviensis CBS 8507 TaxID=1296122 RepID=UPI00080D1443|nr:uncharacterized protein I203_05904 [Kwoniella mangroviensis CBS 8507]OCF65162.1 hypothetical protein I203_05904 [Kwoniella mangroviensis CBS 8507]
MAKRRSGFTLVEYPCPGDHSSSKFTTKNHGSSTTASTSTSGGRHMMENYGTGKETICYKCMTDYSHSHLFATECTKRGENNLLTEAVESYPSYQRECLIDELYPSPWAKYVVDIVAGKKPEGMKSMKRRKGSHRQILDGSRSKNWSDRCKSQSTIRSRKTSCTITKESRLKKSDEHHQDATGRTKNSITYQGRCEGRRIVDLSNSNRTKSKGSGTSLNENVSDIKDSNQYKKYGRGVDEVGRCRVNCQLYGDDQVTLCARCVQKPGTVRAWCKSHPRSDRSNGSNGSDRSTWLHDLMELYTERVEAKQDQNGIPIGNRQRTVPWRILPSIFKSVYHPEYLQYIQSSGDDTLGRQLSQLPPEQMEDVTGIMFEYARRTGRDGADEKEEGDEEVNLTDVKYSPTMRNSFDVGFTESHMSSPASNSSPMTSFSDMVEHKEDAEKFTDDEAMLLDYESFTQGEINYIDHPENMDLLYDLEAV